ncbi:hypothetical protein AN639_04995 [Candidatus Epulonipiscium fishelsonii]|uniref:Uncharacterized protein n=1 Tax=Candidatus Epulonipiscium fishelsonii TaxID=77094 RepID=A0ACC8XFM7_9FIRM|nr:hypothetical protein AN639_04995 [Epulopiscium sp. SCG-B05WGA-EpuloA1]ONI42311.1 hypothetical protein AN396_01925 [Epulopiscium sp. SCG-B11WGA-EpuloA1]
MIFSSVSFLFLFLPIVFGGYLLVPNIKLKNMWLLLASLLFYAWGEPIYIMLMIFSTFINWKFGLVIEKKPTLLKYVVIINLGILFIFKYLNFVTSSLNIAGLETNISLPIGISFFTFQAMSYVIDVKRGVVEAQKSYLSLLLYICLFPQLIAGPIIKYHDIATQIMERTINVDKIYTGINRFIIGLSKKMIVSNTLAVYVDTIFSTDVTSLNIVSTWIGAFAYVFQIYFDFSGYSDMAIGLGKMFGFEFKENFNYPLTATSIKDFWNRWHISLSTWFKEYLYIPLGGNRNGKTYRNLMIVFLATGIWHGANWTFVLWGVFNGIFLILERKKFIQIKLRPLQHMYTFLVVTLLFVLFRADNIEYAMGYFKTMFFGFDMTITTCLELITPFTMFIFVVAIIGSTPILKFVQNRLSRPIVNIGGYLNTMVLLFINVLFLASDVYSPFIYFRF